LQGNRSRREDFDADEKEGKEKEETLSEVPPRMGPDGFPVSATAETFLVRTGVVGARLSPFASA
jgi:hypothetical protein